MATKRYIQRNYRIRPDQDKKVKKLEKQWKKIDSKMSENEVVRRGLDLLPEPK